MNYHRLYSVYNSIGRNRVRAWRKHQTTQAELRVLILDQITTEIGILLCSNQLAHDGRDHLNGMAAFIFLVYSSSLFSPSSGVPASHNCLTIALPIITPSAPQPAICLVMKISESCNTGSNRLMFSKKVQRNLIHLFHMLRGWYTKANSYRFVCNL